MDLALFILVLVWDTSSSFLKPLLTCGIVSQGTGGVIASAEYSLEGGNFQPFFMAVHESDERGVETWGTQCEGRSILQRVMRHQCQAVMLALICANTDTLLSV